MNKSSHLDIEIPKFNGQPHIWIQWKGTKVCCDIHCTCGNQGHYDGYFLYFFRCPDCDQIWEVGTHIILYPVDVKTDERFLKGAEPIIQELDYD